MGMGPGYGYGYRDRYTDMDTSVREPGYEGIEGKGGRDSAHGLGQTHGQGPDGRWQ